MTYQTIQLVIETELPNEQLLEIFNEGTSNLKELGIVLHEIVIKDSANSLVKELNMVKEKNNKKCRNLR